MSTNARPTMTLDRFERPRARGPLRFERNPEWGSASSQRDKCLRLSNSFLLVIRMLKRVIICCLEGPSNGLLFANDQILAVNGEDVSEKKKDEVQLFVFPMLCSSNLFH